ncbi:MAG: nucleotidyltransferase [Ardenticatenaceae bacterium]
MQTLIQSAAQIQKRLDEADVASAVIGALAVSIWGEPRLTRDADLRVFLQRDQADYLVGLLEPDYVCLASEPENTLRQMGFLFVKDSAGVRIDLMLSDTIFDEEAIYRARSVEVSSGLELVVCSPEDLIVYKMISTRPRDWEDVKGVVRRQKGSLDDAYIINWLEEFELALDDSTLVNKYQRMRRKV